MVAGVCCKGVTIALSHFRVLCKFAFSLSQDWELPLKREVSCQLEIPSHLLAR